MRCTVKPLSVIWLNSHNQENIKLCRKQKGQLFSLYPRTKHEKDEQNWNNTLNTRIIVPPCHLFTCAFWPLWSVYAWCSMEMYFGTFYFKNCPRMPTHSSTVHSLRILADPSQYILCAVACTVPEETPGSTVCSFLGRQNKPNPHLSSVFSDQGQYLYISKVTFLPCVFRFVVCIGRNHHKNIRMEYCIENNRMWIMESYSRKL